jgi:hypothetical protein
MDAGGGPARAGHTHRDSIIDRNTMAKWWHAIGRTAMAAAIL